jgi:5-methylcytosine-specific restriction endonuclease McrA
MGCSVPINYSDLMMTRVDFTDAQRYAIFTVHGERCYMCRGPLDLLSMEVDHIIPSSLGADPDKLRSVIEAFDLPADFDLESYANWLPACKRCNNRKRALVFKPSLIIQVELQKAAEKAVKAKDLAGRRVTDSQVAKAWNRIKTAWEQGSKNPALERDMREFLEFHVSERDKDMVGEPIRLAPGFEVLSDNGRIRVIRGPFGVGGGPSAPSPHVQCPFCGSAAWNGARCVMCGEMDDG